MKTLIGKRQVILAALVLGLSVAVYLNWEYANINSGQLEPTGSLIESGRNYGEASYVDGEAQGADEGEAYFAQAKITRSQTREAAREALMTLINDQSVPETQKALLTEKAADLAASVEVEGKIENLIKAKGFAECMVYYDTERVDVIVKTNGLLEDEVLQMRDIILKETNLPVENISIIEVN